MECYPLLSLKDYFGEFPQLSKFQKTPVYKLAAEELEEDASAVAELPAVNYWHCFEAQKEPKWLRAAGDLRYYTAGAKEPTFVVKRTGMAKNLQTRTQQNRRDMIKLELTKGLIQPFIPNPAEFAVVAFPKKAPFSPLDLDKNLTLRMLGNPNVTAKLHGPDLYEGSDARLYFLLRLAESNRAYHAEKNPQNSIAKNFCHNNMTSTWIIYAIIIFDNIVEGAFFPRARIYIGQTRQTFKERMTQHGSMHTTFVDYFLHAIDTSWSNSPLSEAGGAIFLMLDCEPSKNPKKLNRLETFYMRMFRTIGPAGLNMKAGET